MASGIHAHRYACYFCTEASTCPHPAYRDCPFSHSCGEIRRRLAEYHDLRENAGRGDRIRSGFCDGRLLTDGCRPVLPDCRRTSPPSGSRLFSAAAVVSRLAMVVIGNIVMTLPQLGGQAPELAVIPGAMARRRGVPRPRRSVRPGSTGEEDTRPVVRAPGSAAAPHPGRPAGLRELAGLAALTGRPATGTALRVLGAAQAAERGVVVLGARCGRPAVEGLS